MNQILQHIPGFVDTHLHKHVDNFQITEELLNLSWIKTIGSIKSFYRWSKSDNLLMAEFEDGYRVLVIGYIMKPEEVDLPVWTPK